MIQMRVSFSNVFARVRALTCGLTCLAVAALLAVGTVFAPSAAAHDVLVSSDPEDGAEVESPSSFSLTFNNDPLDVNPVIAISGPDGQESALDVTPVVDGRDVYVELPEMSAGEYAVSWRVVSSDGHPISGEQSFTVLPSADEPADTGDEEPVTDPDEPVSSDDDVDADTDGDSDSDAADDNATSDDGQESESTADAQDNDSSGLPTGAWIAIIISVAVALGLFGTSASRKKKDNPGDDTPSQS